MTPRELAERSLLCALLNLPITMRMVREWLVPADFANDDHQVVFEHLRRMVAQLEDEGGDLTRPVTMYTLGPPPVPLERARPDIYGRFVLEASIRSRVEQIADDAEIFGAIMPPIAVVADFTGYALSQAKRLGQRWATAIDRTTTRAVSDVLDHARSRPPTPAGVDLDHRRDRYVLPPTVQLARPVADAERAILGHVIADPALLGHIAGRLEPADFSDASVGRAYAAATDLYRSGQPVDAVTVAWWQRQQELTPGDALAVDELVRAASAGYANQAHSPQTTAAARLAEDIEVVQRGALAHAVIQTGRVTAYGSRDYTLSPENLLSTLTGAYQQIRALIDRMTGAAGIATSLNTMEAAAVLPFPTHTSHSRSGNAGS